MGYIIIRSSIKDSDLIIKPTTFIFLFVSSHQKSTSTHFHFPPYNKITQVPPFHHFNLFIKPIKRSVCSSQDSRRSVTKMASSSSILRQLSGKEGWNSTSSSKRWSSSNKFGGGGGSGNVGEKSLKQMQGLNGGGGYNNFCGGGMVMRKRVMVVVDQSSSSKHAMMWALTHVTNKGDLLTLLHIIPPQTHHNSDNSHERFSSSPSNLAHSLGSLCKASKPEVEVEALVVQGPKLATVMNQVKKLEVSVLVLGQKKPSLISCFCGSSSEAFVEHCINNAECLTLGVRRQSQGMGGYLISSRWQKNFWLLA